MLRSLRELCTTAQMMHSTCNVVKDGGLVHQTCTNAEERVCLDSNHLRTSGLCSIVQVYA